MRPAAACGSFLGEINNYRGSGLVATLYSLDNALLELRPKQAEKARSGTKYGTRVCV